jgi:hypothetical protein
MRYKNKNKMEMIKRIRMPKGGATNVATLMRLSRKTIDNALSGRVNNELARRIRRCALQHGGVEEALKIPRGQWLVNYDHSGGVMTVQFWNGWLCEIGLLSEATMKTIAPDGRVVEERPAPVTRELMAHFVEVASKE